MDITADSELLILLRRAHPGFFHEKYPYRVLVRDEYRPERGWDDHNQELVVWLNDRRTKVYKVRGVAGTIIHNRFTGFDWMHLCGCYAMNDQKVAAEFRLLFG